MGGWRGETEILEIGNLGKRLWKTLSGEIGMILMERIGINSKYVIDIIVTDPLSLGELGGGGISLALVSSVLLDVLGR